MLWAWPLEDEIRYSWNMLSNRAIKQENKPLVPTWQVKQIGNKLQIFLTHLGCNLNLWIQGNSLFLKSSLFLILSYTLGDMLLWKQNIALWRHFRCYQTVKSLMITFKDFSHADYHILE